MITRVDDRLRQEARRYRLAFTCESCQAFDREHVRCAYGFPTAPHHQVDLDRAEFLSFCKAFELA